MYRSTAYTGGIRLSLTQWMLAALAAGLVCGLTAPEFSRACSIVANIFLRLIQSVIAPLLFGVLVSAVAHAGRPRDLGRMGIAALVYFEVMTTFALLLGWAAAVLFQPGAGAALALERPAAPTALNPGEIITGAFPASILDAMRRGDILPIVVFSLLFGLSCNAVGPRAETVVRFCESLTQIAFQYTRYVMYLAPPAIFAAMAATVAGSGRAALEGLGRFIAAAWFAQALFALVFLGGSLALARVRFRPFLRAVREPFLVAFATTSSAAALPQALANLERFGVPPRILAFALPLSLSFNLNGSMIHLAMAAFFVAQAAGIGLPLSTQLAILLTLKLTGKGVAGIPRANFVVLAGLFASFGLPAEGLTLLLGADALVDPVRTGVNILSHCAAPVVVSAAAASRENAQSPGGRSESR